MAQGLQTIPKSQIRLVVADREFSGQEGFVWLDEQDIRFVIRIKENARIKSAKGPSPLTKQVANLQIHPETSLRKPRLGSGHALSLCARRLPEQGLILVSLVSKTRGNNAWEA